MFEGIAAQIDDVERRVEVRPGDGAELKVLTLHQVYDAALDDVWDACTSAERIPRWFLPISGDLRLGGHYQLEGNASGEILECEPPRRFLATWEYGGDVSWVEIRLTEESDERTSLVLEHRAYVDAERWAEFGPGATGVGWDLGLLGLRNHLATGAAVDHQQAMEWSASEEAKQFMTASSDAWRSASIGAGTDAADADAAAARTTAAYTGAEQT